MTLIVVARQRVQIEWVDAVARKRGCLVRGRNGEYDREKAAIVLLTDYRSGALGRISLETPASRQKALAQQIPSP